MSKAQPTTDEKTASAGFWLKRHDQVTLALFIVLAWTLLLVYWFQQGGWDGRLMEIEQLPVRQAAFEVDVNTAPWAELAQIPEIGETIAQRIVAHREQHGPFRSLDDLRSVPGIGERTLQQMRPALKPIPTE